ncbi:MAG: cobalamin biosynthesis protein CobD [Nitrospirae bacterium]|nr:cobalamin biosynthesis protein CobD [Nitrospirota bacterium]
MSETIILISAYILDWVIGDPRRLPHPVRGIGWAIEKMERILMGKGQRAEGSGQNLTEKLTGVLLAAAVVGGTYSIFYLINLLVLTSHFSLLTSYLSFALLVYLAATTLATHDLIKSGKAVIDALNSGNKEEAKIKLGMIVGRDTKDLDDKGMAKATIETLAENASDGIIAPMFYFAIGGLPLAMAYKAVNTLDSMVGYRNERYGNFGWASARLDDIVNYIPARITGILIVITAFVLGLRGWGAGVSKKTNPQSLAPNPTSSFKMMIRDGRKHLSPNSGIPEAAMAGALGVRLGGPSFYGGVLVEKPYIGEEPGVKSQESGVKIQDELLTASRKAISIVRIASVLGLLFALIFMYLRSAVCCK